MKPKRGFILLTMNVMYQYNYFTNKKRIKMKKILYGVLIGIITIGLSALLCDANYF